MPFERSSTSFEASRVWLWAGVLTALLIALFAPTFYRLAVEIWDRDPNYTHGYLIVPVSLILAWRIGREDGRPGEGEPLLGGVSLLAGAILHAFTILLGWLPLDFPALILILRGLLVLVGGREWASLFWFPILFLFFMFPLPYSWTLQAAMILQDWVTFAATAVLELFFECFHRGNVIVLMGVEQPLNVAEECSGLRQIVAFLALGTLVGHFANRGWVVRLLLVLAALPIAFLSNVVRVVLMALSLKFFGPGSIGGFMHDFYGVLPIPLGLFFYFVAVQAIAPRDSEGGRP